MLRQILAITWKELKVLSHDRAALALLFAMPAIFILIMTNATSGLYTSGRQQPLEVLLVNDDQGPIGGKIFQSLGAVQGWSLVTTVDGQAVTRTVGEGLIRQGRYGAMIYFPPDFSAKVNEHVQSPQASAQIELIADPALGEAFLAPVLGTVQGYAEREASMGQVPQLFAGAIRQGAAGLPPEAVQTFTQSIENSLGPALQNFDAGVKVQVRAPAGFVAAQFPSPAQQNVPAYTIFGVFFITQTLALSLYREKQEGTFRRLLAAPLSRPALLLGKLLPYFLVNLVQIAQMFLVGVLAFHLSLGNDPLALIVISLFTSAAATGMGLFIAGVTRSAEQAAGISTLLSVGLSALGGMFVPTFVMPAFMQTLARITPHYWALAAYQDVMVRGLGLNALVPELGSLLGFTVLFFGIAVWRFRFT